MPKPYLPLPPVTTSAVEQGCYAPRGSVARQEWDASTDPRFQDGLAEELPSCVPGIARTVGLARGQRNVRDLYPSKVGKRRTSRSRRARTTSPNKSRHDGLCFSMSSTFRSRRHRFMVRSRRAAICASACASNSHPRGEDPGFSAANLIPDRVRALAGDATSGAQRARCRRPAPRGPCR